MAEKIISNDEAMRRAIALAKKGHGFVSPNPVVGCVILSREGSLIGEGFHKKVGGPHAEVEALKKVKDQELLNGARVFITLEPCSHYGRTPPCAEALSQLPLSEVIFGLLDPNPKVSGKGAAMLRAAGITCSQFSGSKEIENELEELAEIFLYNQRQQKTFVSLKVATSLDGRLGMKSGESKWITGEAAREFSHTLRAQYDAVLIGKRTFLEDDPSLNIRLKDFENHQNAVVIIDPRGECLPRLASSNLAKVRDFARIFVASYEDVSATPNVLHVRRNEKGNMDLEHLLELLWQKDIKSLFVEGGAQTFAGFLEKRLVRRLHSFLAPCLIGGLHGASWTEHFGSHNFSERIEMAATQSKQIGKDFYLSMKPIELSL